MRERRGGSSFLALNSPAPVVAFVGLSGERVGKLNGMVEKKIMIKIK